MQVEAAMNRALANLVGEMAKLRVSREHEDEPDSPEHAKQGHRRLEGAGDNMVRGGVGQETPPRK